MIRKIINRVKRINFLFFKFKNNIYNQFNKNKYKKNVGIVSCDKWIGRVKEDYYLKDTLNKLKIKADIISWQDKSIDYKKYDALIIKSIWGFQKHYVEFNNWLDYLNKNNIKVFNELDIIRNNYDKEKQFNILDNYSINHVPTKFISGNLTKEIESIYKNNVFNSNLLVVKPVVSESGNDTYVIGDNNRKNGIELDKIDEKFDNVKGKLMIQPFIKEVDDGEYSVCYINNKLTHAVLRFPNVFNSNNNSIRYIPVEKIDDELKKITERIINIKEYKNNLYMRIDVIKKKNEYLVMEVELMDPQLFIHSITDKKKRKEVYEFLANSLLNKIG